MTIEFRPVTAADLPMLAEWIARPHWQEWWGDPAEEVAHIRDMVAGRDTTRPFIFCEDGAELGYIQAWHIADQRVEPWLTVAPWLTALPDDAVGVDLSIAEAGRLGRGLGSRALVAFVAMLRAEGHETIVIDPDPANARAVRAYEKAGFRPIPALLGRTGDSLLMQFGKEWTAP